MTEKIDYDGQQIPINLGVVAYKRAKKDLGKSFEEALSEDELLAYETLLWYSIEAGYYLEKKDNPWKREDAEWIFNESEDQFLEIYMRSQMKTFERNKEYLKSMGMDVDEAVKLQQKLQTDLKKNLKNSSGTS